MRMVAILLALGLSVWTIPVAAQSASATAKPAAPAPGPAPAVAAKPAAAQGDAAKIESLQQRLLASQQTVASLERELEAAKNRAVVMDQCRTKNGRLVYIARELIEAYEKRYKLGHKDPLQLGRRQFEFELQALSDAVYTDRVDVPIPAVPGEKHPAEPTEAAAKPDKKSSKSKAAAPPPADPAPVPAPAPAPAPASPAAPTKAP